MISICSFASPIKVLSFLMFLAFEFCARPYADVIVDQQPEHVQFLHRHPKHHDNARNPPSPCAYEWERSSRTHIAYMLSVVVRNCCSLCVLECSQSNNATSTHRRREPLLSKHCAALRRTSENNGRWPYRTTSIKYRPEKPCFVSFLSSSILISQPLFVCT